MNRKHIREMLSEARKANGLTLEQLSAATGVARTSLSSGTLGGAKMREVAKYLGLDAGDVERAWYADAGSDLDRRWDAWWGAP